VSSDDAPLFVARVIAKLEPGGAQLGAFRLSASLRRHGIESHLLVGDATRAGIQVALEHGLEPECFQRRVTGLQWTPSLFHTRPVVIMLIRKPERSEGFAVAVASTDTSATTAELIARYDSRWTIETAHQEAKAHGVGQARNRVRKAVERTVPFGFLTMTITIAWYALHGDPDADLDARRRAAPWYRQKATISYADMLAALRRGLIRHEYWAQAPCVTTNSQITTAPSPSALTAA
jgi:hypothetical protein